MPAGYRSYHSGKWHIDGDPRANGFAHSLQIEGGQNDYFDPDGITVDGVPIKAASGRRASAIYKTASVSAAKVAKRDMAEIWRASGLRQGDAADPRPDQRASAGTVDDRHRARGPHRPRPALHPQRL